MAKIRAIEEGGGGGGFDPQYVAGKDYNSSAFNYTFDASKDYVIYTQGYNKSGSTIMGTHTIIGNTFATLKANSTVTSSYNTSTHVGTFSCAYGVYGFHIRVVQLD